MNEMFEEIYINALKYNMPIVQNGHILSTLSIRQHHIKIIYNLDTNKLSTAHVHIRAGGEEIIAIVGY